METPNHLTMASIVQKDEDTIAGFVSNLNSEEKLLLAKHSLKSMDFVASNLIVPSAAVQELRNLRNKYRVDEAQAQLDAALTGDKSHAKQLLVLSGYIECLNFLISVAEQNNSTPTTEGEQS